MKHKRNFVLTLVSVVLLFTQISFVSHAALTNQYYGSGSYISSAPVQPKTGLKFYVDSLAINKYGSSAFTTAFDWNNCSKTSVAAIAQYPASSSAYSDHFLITTGTMSTDIRGETFYYNSSGQLINVTYPMDSTTIYKCSIKLNSNSAAFNVDGTFNSTFLKKVVRHEVGHVFLLKHPSNLYFSSVMHQGAPNGSTISATITTDDKNNMAAKWGN